MTCKCKNLEFDDIFFDYTNEELIFIFVYEKEFKFKLDIEEGSGFDAECEKERLSKNSYNFFSVLEHVSEFYEKVFEPYNYKYNGEIFNVKNMMGYTGDHEETFWDLRLRDSRVPSMFKESENNDN